MLTPEQIETRLDRVLLKVQKPGRYVGGELNQIVKSWESISSKVALIFPDIYDLGLPNLGLAILYDEINQRPDALAERAYAPWTDMESEMRAAGIPLYGLESKHALAEFDILAFTMPYETIYTNILNILDLSGLPLRTSQRTQEHPLVIAGGHAAFNPEPMSPFIDAFVIGEGEEVIHEIIQAHLTWYEKGEPRERLWERLARIQGVYVPSLYSVEYAPDGTLTQFTANTSSASLPVVKRVVAQLHKPITRFLVPSIDIVHNRISIEIMRGCTRGCRFCQAGMITRPVRERPVQEILETIEESLRYTGYEEVGLVSLSSSDYTQVKELVEAVRLRFGSRKLSVALPSLRIESFSVDLMDGLKELRPGGGFTLAPEAATERMRQIINKPISTSQLLETVREIYSRGWTTIKLYFMIGHPEETIEDVQAIIDTCKMVLAEGRRFHNGRARVHAGVSTFIPKAHTPFQWVPCDSIEQVREKQYLLRGALRGNGYKLTWVDPEVTLLEAWLSRGDRRSADVIEQAWKLGAKFDAWQDEYHYNLWVQAYQDCGLDPYFYSHRARSTAEILPWSHISTAVRASYLKEEYAWSKEGRLRSDCRDQCFACGILPGFNELRVNTPEEAWKCPPVKRKVRVQSKIIETSEGIDAQ
jgi:radical SAM family uncharacterized protein